MGVIDGLAANGENRRLTNEACARQEEVLKIKTDLEDSLKGKAEVEAQKEELAKNLQDANSNFIANCHLTDAYTSFSNYFASVRQHEVIIAFRSKRPDLDLSFLEAKFPPMDIEDPPEE
ncbi:hypothetical protein Fot_09892 [Forsythia ovata]|uniref:V-type proton ATPase subunit G n=1 Tax=Forsythia ovata TaxID=205694 RepID=A0ABD1WFJ9_9LAMI